MIGVEEKLTEVYPYGNEWVESYDNWQLSRAYCMVPMVIQDESHQTQLIITRLHFNHCALYRITRYFLRVQV